MTAIGCNRQRWVFSPRAGVAFTVVYIIDVEPWNLSFTMRGHNVFFDFKISSAFYIPDRLSSTLYNVLAKALRTTGASGNRLVPSEFFQEFDRQVPAQASTGQKPRYFEIARLRKDIDDGDKIYFCGWKSNGARGNVRNEWKTKLLLGDAALQWSLKNNESSCWTDDLKKAIDPHICGNKLNV